MRHARNYVGRPKKGGGCGDRMRTCTVCRWPELNDIEAALRASIPYRDIARQHGLSKDSLSRHRASHLSPIIGAPGAPNTPQIELSAGYARILACLDSAEQGDTWNLTLLAVREARSRMEALLVLSQAPAA